MHQVSFVLTLGNTSRIKTTVCPYEALIWKTKGTPPPLWWLLGNDSSMKTVKKNRDKD